MVSYAIDMLQLLSKQQKAIQTTIKPDTTNANEKISTQSTREPKESDQQKAYAEIEITLERQNNNGSQKRPKQKSRKEIQKRTAPTKQGQP